MAWLTRDGYRMEMERAGPRRLLLHVTQHGAEVGYFESVGALGQKIDLSEIHEVEEFEADGPGLPDG
jgi:hypothetical protein